MSNTLEQAKQGNPEAINLLIAKKLTLEKISSKVTLKDKCLQILLESELSPNQVRMLTFLRRGLEDLKPEGIERVRIFGRTLGEELPDWTSEIELVSGYNPFRDEKIDEFNAGYIPKKEQTILDPNINYTQLIKNINNWFKIFWISMSIGIFACLVIAITAIFLSFSSYYYDYAMSSPLMILILILCIIGIVTSVVTSVVFSFMMLYKFWQIIQDGQARTTPGKAVGFCFIPFFSFYWLFIAYLGLSKDINNYIRCRKINASLVNESLVLIYCILICCSLIPWVSILTFIPAFVIWWFMFAQFKRSSISILKYKANNKNVLKSKDTISGRSFR